MIFMHGVEIPSVKSVGFEQTDAADSFWRRESPSAQRPQKDCPTKASRKVH